MSIECARRRRRIALHAAGACVALVAWAANGRPAAADELGSALGEPLFETSHDVSLRVAGGIATWTVHRVITNEGRTADEADLVIEIPRGTAMTGMRARFGGTWAAAVLKPREEAARLYQGTGPDGAFSGGAALAEWIDEAGLSLSVYPVPPGGAVEIEYTLLGLASYESGRWVVGYPRAADEAPAATPVLRAVADAGAPVAFVVDGHRVPAGSSFALRGARPADLSGSFAGRNVWPGVVEDGLPFAASAGTVTAATVTVEVRHPYAGDLGFALLPPHGDAVPLHAADGLPGAGASRTFEAKLPPQPGAGTWRLRVTDEAPGDAGMLASWKLTLRAKDGATPSTGGTPRAAIPDGELLGSDGAGVVGWGEVRIEIDAPRAPAASADGLGVRYGAVNSGSVGVRSLWLDAAPELRPAPKGATVVFLLDVSRSVGADGLAAELAAAAAYLAARPDARFEIVAFSRKAERLTGKIAPAAELADAVKAARAAGKLELRNGSAVDEALRVTSEVLRGVKGPAAVVGLTDALARPRLDLAAAAKALAVPASVPLHLVRAHGGGDVLAVTRVSDDDLVALPAAHGGAMFDFDGVDLPRTKEVGWVARELVRPTRIEELAVRGLGELEPMPAFLDEGVGLHWTLEASAADAKRAAPAVAPVVVSGKIWGRPFERKVAPAPGLARATVATAVGSGAMSDAGPDGEKMVRAAGVASYATSFVVAHPGGRPARGGIGRSADYAGLGGMGARGSRIAAKAPTPSIDLAPRLKAGVDSCIGAYPAPPGWSVTLLVDTTYDEVVDVDFATGGEPTVAPPAGLAACLIEAGWALRLDRKTFYLERESYYVTLPAK